MRLYCISLTAKIQLFSRIYKQSGVEKYSTFYHLVARYGEKSRVLLIN